MSNFFNWTLKVIATFKKDIGFKIGSFLVATGVFILSGGFVFSAKYQNAAGETLEISYDNALSWWLIGLGTVFCFAGLLVLVNRYYLFGKTKDAILIYASGFQNQYPGPPVASLPLIDRFTATTIIFSIEDSYDTSEIILEYAYYKKLIANRQDYETAKTIYLAGLGSVPYLFSVGALFRDGHAIVTLLEHERTTGWHTLKHFGEENPLIYLLNNQKIDLDAAILKIQANKHNQIALALSFTFDIVITQLPQGMGTNTLFLVPGSGSSYDAFSSENVQNKTMKLVAHTMQRLAAKADEVHLFIAAQSSVVMNLGRLYQNGAHGPLVIHNYDPDQKKYAWAIRFNKGNIGKYTI